MKINAPDIREVELAFINLMQSLNLDLTDSNLKDTPKRLAKMYINELFCGLYEDEPLVKEFESEGRGFLYTKVPFKSTCAHHFQPIHGDAHIFVDYSNSKYVLGLSKFNRIVDYYARRPTLQEQLTNDILTSLITKLGTEDVMVILEASHACVTDRGVCAAYSNTITQLTKSTSKEFINNCNMHFTRGV